MKQCKAIYPFLSERTSSGRIVRFLCIFMIETYMVPSKRECLHSILTISIWWLCSLLALVFSKRTSHSDNSLCARWHADSRPTSALRHRNRKRGQSSTSISNNFRNHFCFDLFTEDRWYPIGASSLSGTCVNGYICVWDSCFKKVRLRHNSSHRAIMTGRRKDECK